VNGLQAKGGSLDGAGPVIFDGMVYVNSGYPRFGGTDWKYPPGLWRGRRTVQIVTT
jgi:hypothetical protein